jgi:hypothetical protein
VSSWHLERAVYLLGHEGRRTSPFESPGDALASLVEDVRNANAADGMAPYPDFRLEPDEVALIADGDVVGMYRRGVHPNLIRAFAGIWKIDLVAEYRDAGL